MEILGWDWGWGWGWCLSLKGWGIEGGASSYIKAMLITDEHCIRFEVCTSS